MKGVSRVLQLLALGLALVVFGLCAGVRAQDAAAPETVWQAVITGQINAFRTGDGVAALGFAGAAFKARYTDPDAFVVDIGRAGYAPIMTSLSHSFGKFDRLDEADVLQVVKFVGPKGMLYEAIYQLMLEDEGWRVQGVALRQSQDISV